jgi:hypothetical protein
MDRRIKTFRQLERVFKPHRMAFKELRGWGRGKQLHVTIISAKKRITPENALFVVGGGLGNNSRIFAFRWGCSNSTPRK